MSDEEKRQLRRRYIFDLLVAVPVAIATFIGVKAWTFDMASKFIEAGY